MAEYTLTPTQSENTRTVEDMRSESESETSDEGCPFCEDYTGDYVAQHASSAHPEEWIEYTEGDGS